MLCGQNFQLSKTPPWQNTPSRTSHTSTTMMLTTSTVHTPRVHPSPRSVQCAAAAATPVKPVIGAAAERRKLGDSDLYVSGVF